MNVDDLTLADELYIVEFGAQALSDLIVDVARVFGGDEKTRFSDLLAIASEVVQERDRLREENRRLRVDLLAALRGETDA